MASRTNPDRRDAILEAAIAQLIARGIGSFRVQDVANASSISTGLIHYHFATKEALIAEAFATQGEGDLSRARSAAERETDPRSRLAAALLAYGPTDQANGWRMWIDGWSEALRSDRIRTVIQRLDDEWTALIESLVQDCQVTELLPSSDTAQTARRLMALLDGLSVRRVVFGSSPTGMQEEDKVASIMSSIIDTELRREPS